MPSSKGDKGETEHSTRWPEANRWTPVLAGLLCAFSIGCGVAARGTFGPDGFSQTVHGYRVNAEAGRVLPPEWQIDNYYGAPDDLTPKSAPEYMIRYDIDCQGDGLYERSEEQLEYDLRYTHGQRDALIWLRTFPISWRLAQKDLRVLAQAYLDEVAGAGYESVRLRSGQDFVIEKRYAAELLDKADAALAGLPAYEITFDVANIDQIRLTPRARKRRVRVILARTNFEYDPQEGCSGLPVLLLAGYANLPEDFARDLPDFVSFLERIETEGRNGYRLRSPASSAPR